MKRLPLVTRSGRKNRAIMLARYPRLGEVKTRLVPPLTAEEALALHDALARHTLRALLAVQATGDAQAEVRTDAAFARVAFDWLGRGFKARYQGEGDLGDRIRLAFGESFGRGADRVVVVGSDCPQLRAGHIREALERLDHVDVVLGPADDGGYYLVALRRESAKRSVPTLFSGVAWGTGSVLESTIALCEESELSWVLLEQLPDVDRPEDVPAAERALAADDLTADASVSVVIPALDDESMVGAAVQSALVGGADEVLVADGGSRDRTREVAEAAGARVVSSQPGRAAQMNAGADAATGGILLFLHADTVLPPDAAALARAGARGARHGGRSLRLCRAGHRSPQPADHRGRPLADTADARSLRRPGALHGRERLQRPGRLSRPADDGGPRTGQAAQADGAHRGARCRRGDLGPRVGAQRAHPDDGSQRLRDRGLPSRGRPESRRQVATARGGPLARTAGGRRARRFCGTAPGPAQPARATLFLPRERNPQVVC